MMFKYLGSLLAILVLASCASSGSGSGRSRSRNLITAEEIAGTSATNAYDAIQLLRPHLLRYRGALNVAESIEPVVYVDNVKRGDMQVLHSLHVATIREIKYLRPNDATTLYGTGHVGGAFVIKTK